MELITNDLILRPVNANDVDEVARMWEWHKGTISTNEASEAIRYMQDNHKKNKHGYIYHLCLAVFEKGCDKIIGWVGLDGTNPTEKRDILLFYSIETPFQKRGYATQCVSKLFEYAFETAGLQHIYGGCYKENIASRQVMEKAGMLLYEFEKENGGPHFYIDKEIYDKLKWLRSD